MSNNILWPGWETVRLIGRGSFGHVYEIRRDLLGEIESAALKVISIPQNDSDIDELYNDGYNSVSITETFRSHLKSILAEYSLMRKLNDCVNIVSCDDVRYIQHDDGIGWDIYIKMELLTPMMKALPQEIPEQTTVKLGRDLCTALVACSRHGIIHRDIKPQNIFVSREGEYKLGDFGIAKTVEKTMGGTKIGTYKYMAPEVYNNQPYGAQSDIYSLGLVLYWMLNDRRLPFLPLPPQNVTAAQDEQARLLRLSGTPVPPPAHGSEALKRIVLKACAYDPANRYASAEEMLRDLQTLPPVRVVPPTVHSSRTVLPVYPISSSQETAEDLTESAFSSTAQPDKQAPLTNDFSDFFQDTLTEEETVHIFRAKSAANATPKPTQPVPVPQKMPPRPAPTPASQSTVTPPVRPTQVTPPIRQQYSAQQPMRKKADPPKKKRNILLPVILTVVLLAAAIAIGAVLLLGGDKTDTNVLAEEIVKAYLWDKKPAKLMDQSAPFDNEDLEDDMLKHYENTLEQLKDAGFRLRNITVDNFDTYDDGEEYDGYQEYLEEKFGIKDDAEAFRDYKFRVKYQSTFYEPEEGDEGTVIQVTLVQLDGQWYLLNLDITGILTEITLNAPWRENIMMQDSFTSGEEGWKMLDDGATLEDLIAYCAQHPVLGSEIPRSQIVSVTFLDTVADAPDSSWDVSADQNSSVLAWAIPNGEFFDLYIAGEGGVNGEQATPNMFAFYTNLIEIWFNGNFYTEYSTDMSNMLTCCISLESVDISSLNTSSVLSMEYMFDNCYSLSALDVSGVNTSMVTDMAGMFKLCTSLRTLDLSGFETSFVTDMELMFYHCSSMEVLDVSCFDTSSVTNMAGMFAECFSLKTVDVSNFDTSAVVDMSSMFQSCDSLTTLDLKSFDTASAINMADIFLGCSSLRTLDLRGFDTSSAAKIHGMFYNCSSLTTLDVSGFDTSSVTSMSGLFYGCSSLTTLDVSGFDTSSVIDMTCMFQSCSSLTTLDVRNFNTSSVMYMNYMFSECTSLQALDVSNFDISNAVEKEGFYVVNGIVHYEGY